MIDADSAGVLLGESAVPAGPWSLPLGGFAGPLQAGDGEVDPAEFATSPSGSVDAFVMQSPAPAAASALDVAALVFGNKWSSVDAATGKTIVTYSFANPLTSVFAYPSPEYPATLSAFAEADKVLTRAVLARIEAVCNVHFVEVPDDSTQCGLVRYGYSQQPSALKLAGYAFFPSADPMGGDVWIATAQAAAVWDFYRPDLILHETLHALGLKHPFDGSAVLPAQENIIPNTVMSYSPVAGSTTGSLSRYPSEPMALDVAALQYLYGAAPTAPGDTVYDLAGVDFQGFRTIWDSGGIDTLDASRLTRGVSLDLNEGAHSNIGVTVFASATVAGSVVTTRYTDTVSIALGAQIENAIGTPAADVLVGNDAPNRLVGGAGGDTLQGRGGDDVLVGGAGSNVLDGGAGLDTAVYEAPRAGFSVALTASGSYVADGSGNSDTLLAIERVSFSDARLALDLDGAAGEAAKVIGAVFGAAALRQPGYVSASLGVLDSGAAYGDFVQLALNRALGGPASHDALVDLLYLNVTGALPTAAQHGYYVDLLNQGIYSDSSLAQLAADSSINLVNIDFAGLTTHGLDYTG